MFNIKYELNKIKEAGLYRNLKYLEQSQNPKTIIDGKEVLLLASNDYLGLCSDERLKKAAIEAINEFGVGSGGSRLTTGSYRFHQEVEEKIAEFLKEEKSIVFNSGYVANVGTISALCDKNFAIFSDELNHTSIIDGCRLSKAKIIVYKHCDLNDLQKKLNKYKRANSLIVTDGVFSMDGDIAPLPDILKLALKENCLTMVDEAHSLGILGKDGRGLREYFNLKEKIDINMGTLSKVLASEGGYVAGDKMLIDYLKNKARSFIYSTASAPANIKVILKALEIVESENERRENLRKNIFWFKNKLRDKGFKLINYEEPTPIIPLIIGDSDKVYKFSELLFEAGIYVPSIRPPSVPLGTSRLRISLMATHTKKDLEIALEKIEKCAKKLKII